MWFWSKSLQWNRMIRIGNLTTVPFMNGSFPTIEWMSFKLTNACRNNWVPLCMKLFWMTWLQISRFAIDSNRGRIQGTNTFIISVIDCLPYSKYFRWILYVLPLCMRLYGHFGDVTKDAFLIISIGNSLKKGTTLFFQWVMH